MTDTTITVAAVLASLILAVYTAHAVGVLR